MAHEFYWVRGQGVCLFSKQANEKVSVVKVYNHVEDEFLEELYVMKEDLLRPASENDVENYKLNVQMALVKREGPALPKTRYPSPVWPGHPLTIALEIVKSFGSYSEASEKGLTYPKALESDLISGAGGNVYGALDFIKYYQQGLYDFEAFCREADDYWGRCDSQKTRYPDRYKAGLLEAASLKDELKARLLAWGK